MAPRSPRALILLAGVLLLAMPSLAPRVAAQPTTFQAGQRTAVEFAENVVRIRMRGLDQSDGEEGFGFVFAERGSDLFIATADHVVEDHEHPIAEVTFYREQGSPKRASVLQLRLPPGEGDLAVVTVRRPDSFRPDWLPIVPTYELRAGTQAWRIGKQRGWLPPVVPGQVVSRSGLSIGFDNLDAPRGSSGGPVVSEQGIIGMILAQNDQAGVPTTVLPIDTIQGVVENWKLPWSFAAPHTALVHPAPPPTQNPPTSATASPASPVPAFGSPVPAFLATPQPLGSFAEVQERMLGLDDTRQTDVQRRLQALGFDPGDIDGDFGPSTRQAIRNYQRARNLPETGFLNDTVMRRLTADQPAPPPRSAPQNASANLPPLAPPPGVFADEVADFNVAPQPFPNPNVGTPTPTQIPGARVITTEVLAGWIRDNAAKNFPPPVLIDVLADAHARTIRGAARLPGPGNGANFTDDVQRALWADLMRLNGGDANRGLVFFCQSSRCWESYNAALRAVRAGFGNVYWYRGGLAAWQQAGLPEMP